MTINQEWQQTMKFFGYDSIDIDNYFALRDVADAETSNDPLALYNFMNEDRTDDNYAANNYLPCGIGVPLEFFYKGSWHQSKYNSKEAPQILAQVMKKYDIKVRPGVLPKVIEIPYVSCMELRKD